MVGFPAARKGDPTTHDMLVPSGVIGPPVTGPCPMGQVVVENLPAAHVNCTAVCTGATSAGPAHPPPPGPPPLIVVGAATVLIHNFPAARWVASGDFSACSALLGDPKLLASRRTIVGGTSSIQQAIADLTQILGERKAELQRWDAAAQRRFETWFGSKDASARQAVLDRVDKMLDLLNAYSQSNFEAAGAKNKPTLFAYVYGDDDSTVYLGDRFGSAPRFGQDSRAGVLAHEMSHFETVGDTDDHVYGVGRAKRLAQNDPDKAMENADNFEYFIEGLN